MERTGAGLGFHFNGARTVAAILRAVVGGQHLELGDGFRIGINVEGGVAAVIHVVATVEFPVVVLGAAAVHAVGDVAVNTHLAVIVAGLINDTGTESDKLGEVAAVEHEFIYLLAGDRAAQVGRAGFDLCDALTGYDDLFGDSADGEGHIDAILIADV